MNSQNATEPIVHRTRTPAATRHPNVRPRISSSRKNESLLAHSCRCFIRVTYAGGFRVAPIAEVEKVGEEEQLLPKL
jgi:hypothetical protein